MTKKIKKITVAPWEKAKLKMVRARDAYNKAQVAYSDSLWSMESCLWRAQRKVWRTSDGSEIKYSDLTDDHLNNAIGSLLLLRPENPALVTLKEELDRRLREKAKAHKPLFDSRTPGIKKESPRPRKSLTNREMRDRDLPPMPW